MNTLLRKEFRLLLPAWIAALVAATMPLWFQWNDRGASLTFSCLAIMFLALAPFGQEMSCGTFSLLLVQPAQRRHFWRVKVGLLALTLLSAWALSALCLWIREQEGPPRFVSPGDFESMIGYSGLAALVAFSGGLWSTLLLRDVTTAFIATLMAPAALCMATVIALTHWINNDALVEAALVGVMAAYSVAGYLVARRLFLGAEDVPPAWTGAQISFPKVRGLSWRWLPRGFEKRRGPWSALIYKELQLQEAAMVFTSLFGLLHLASLAVRYFAPAWAAKADHFSFLPFFWLVMSVVVGCAAVAEERRQNTLEGLLCAPVRKRHQFAVKFAVALAMGTVLGGVVPWGLDALADAMNLPRGYAFMHYQVAVAAAVTVVSFYASTLSRSLIQALTTLVCVLGLAGLAGALAETVGDHFQYEGVIVNGGLLFPALALPALLGTLRWLSFRNYTSLQTGWRLWLGNLARVIVVFAVVWFVAGAIFNRCWDFFTPLEPPHGPARLSGPGRAMIANSRRHEICVLLPDGRLWAGALDRAWENLSGRFAAGSNWVDVAGGFFEDPVALKSDGTLWKFLRGAEPRQIGSDADWKKVVAGPMFFLALKQDGTIWGWGTNEFGVLTTNLYGLTNVPDPVRLWQDSDWVDVFVPGPGEAMAVKRDGTLWKWGFADTNYSAYHQLVRIDVVGPGWSSLAASYDNLMLGVRTDGTLWAGRYNLFPYELPAGAPAPDLFGAVIPRDTLTKFARIGTRTDWVGVSEGGDQFLADEADGTLWAIRCYTLETKRPSKYRDWLAASADSGLDWALAKDGTISCWVDVFRIGPYNERDPYYGFNLSPSRRPWANVNILDAK